MKRIKPETKIMLLVSFIAVVIVAGGFFGLLKGGITGAATVVNQGYYYSRDDVTVTFNDNWGDNTITYNNIEIGSDPVQVGDTWVKYTYTAGASTRGYVAVYDRNPSTPNAQVEHYVFDSPGAGMGDDDGDVLLYHRDDADIWNPVYTIVHPSSLETFTPSLPDQPAQFEVTDDGTKYEYNYDSEGGTGLYIVNDDNNNFWFAEVLPDGSPGRTWANDDGRKGDESYPFDNQWEVRKEYNEAAGTSTGTVWDVRVGDTINGVMKVTNIEGLEGSRVLITYENSEGESNSLAIGYHEMNELSEESGWKVVSGGASTPADDVAGTTDKGIAADEESPPAEVAGEGEPDLDEVTPELGEGADIEAAMDEEVVDEPADAIAADLAAADAAEEAGHAAVLAGNDADAAAHFEDAAAAYTAAAGRYDDMGETANAADAYDQAGYVSVLAGNDLDAAVAYANAGDLYYEVENDAAAAAAYSDAGDYYDEANDPTNAAAAYANAGDSYYNDNNDADAAVAYHNAADIYYEQENDADAAAAYDDAAAAYYNNNDPAAAGAAYEDAANSYYNTDNDIDAAAAYNDAADAYDSAGRIANENHDYAAAATYFDNAGQAATDAGNDAAAGLAYANAAAAYTANGETANAAEAYEDAALAYADADMDDQAASMTARADEKREEEIKEAAAAPPEGAGGDFDPSRQVSLGINYIDLDGEGDGPGGSTMVFSFIDPETGIVRYYEAIEGDEPGDWTIGQAYSSDRDTTATMDDWDYYTSTLNQEQLDALSARGRQQLGTPSDADRAAANAADYRDRHNRMEQAAWEASQILNPSAGANVMGEWMATEWFGFDTAGWYTRETLPEWVSFAMEGYETQICDWKRSEAFVQDYPGHYQGGIAPGITDMHYITAERIEFGGTEAGQFDISWAGECDFDGDVGSRWFPKDEYEPMGYLYRLSWYVSNPISEGRADELGEEACEDLDMEANDFEFDTDCSLRYRLRIKGKTCDIRTGTKGVLNKPVDAAMFVVAPGTVSTYTFSTYDVSLYESVCIEFLDWDEGVDADDLRVGSSWPSGCDQAVVETTLDYETDFQWQAGDTYAGSGSSSVEGVSVSGPGNPTSSDGSGSWPCPPYCI